MNARKTVLSALTGFALVAIVALPAVANGPKNFLLKPTPNHFLPKFGFTSFNTGFGERITSVKFNGRAANLGLEPGDVIVKLNGYRLTYHGSWNDALYDAVASGGRTRLVIRDVRSGQFVTRDVFVGGYPGPITHKKHGNGPFDSDFDSHPHDGDYPTFPGKPKSKFDRPNNNPHRNGTDDTIKEFVKLLN